MKKSIKKIIESLGYKIYNKYFMDCGIDLSYDISQFSNLNDIKIVFDIGANEGYMSDLYHNIFPNSDIHAFEPVSSTFQLLSKKVKNRKRVISHNFGFSNKIHEEKIYLQSDSGFNSVSKKVNKPDNNMDNKFETIRLDTIDNFCFQNNINKIDFLKSDTEGLDLLVLKGGENLIKKGQIKYILIEVGFNEDNHRNTNFEEVRKYLYNYGYKLRAFHDQHNFGNVPYITCVNALFFHQST